jgi:hypothetical protein
MVTLLEFACRYEGKPHKNSSRLIGVWTSTRRQAGAVPIHSIYLITIIIIIIIAQDGRKYGKFPVEENSFSWERGQLSRKLISEPFSL